MTLLLVITLESYVMLPWTCFISILLDKPVVYLISQENTLLANGDFYVNVCVYIYDQTPSMIDSWAAPTQ